MTIIEDVYDMIAKILEEMVRDVGEGGVFNASEFYVRYRNRYPADEDVMTERQQIVAGAHGLEGYLDGILFEYSQRQQAPRIEQLGAMTYRLV